MDTLRISQFGFLIYAPFIKSSRLSLLGLLFKLEQYHVSILPSKRRNKATVVHYNYVCPGRAFFFLNIKHRFLQMWSGSLQWQDFLQGVSSSLPGSQ